MRATNIGANILFVVVVVADVDEYVRQNTNSLTNNTTTYAYPFALEIYMHMHSFMSIYELTLPHRKRTKSDYSKYFIEK